MKSARVILLVGAVVSAFAFWALESVVGTSVIDALLGAFLMAAVPTLAVAQVPVIGSAEIERVPAYLSSIFTLCLVGGAAGVVGWLGGGPESLGLVSLGWSALIGWTLLGTAAALLLMVVFRSASVRLGLVDSRLLEELLPRTPGERRLFVWLSLAAGVGEELAYRGYAIMLLAPALGPWPAAWLTSAVFGVMHAYQGLLGVLRTGLLGLLLAAIFLWSGSLWPAILAHTLLDIVAGLWLGDRLLVTRDDIAPRKA